jgi:hypothetical protein
MIFRCGICGGAGKTSPRKEFNMGPFTGEPVVEKKAHELQKGDVFLDSEGVAYVIEVARMCKEMSGSIDIRYFEWADDEQHPLLMICGSECVFETVEV